MNEKKHLLPKALLIIAIVVAVAAVGGTFLVKYLQREQWIVQTADTQIMADARKGNDAGRLITKSLLSKRVTQENCTLYNAQLYPEVQTVICTVDRPKQFEDFAAYLVSAGGTVYPGWYNPPSMGDYSSERYGVIKVIFEGLSTTEIVKLNIVDKSKIVGEYDPDTATSQISFDLTPPPLEASSDSSSS